MIRSCDQIYQVLYTLYSVHCNAYGVHCIPVGRTLTYINVQLYDVQCTPYIISLTLYHVQLLYIIHCTRALYTAQCTVYSVHCILSTLYTMHCTVYIVHCATILGQIPYTGHRLCTGHHLPMILQPPHLPSRIHWYGLRLEFAHPTSFSEYELSTIVFRILLYILLVYYNMYNGWRDIMCILNI